MGKSGTQYVTNSRYGTPAGLRFTPLEPLSNYIAPPEENAPKYRRGVLVHGDLDPRLAGHDIGKPFHVVGYGDSMPRVQMVLRELEGASGWARLVNTVEATPFGPQTMVSFRGPKQRTRSSSMGSMPSILLRLSLWPSLLAAWRLKGTMLELTTTLHYNIKCPTKALSGALVKAFYRAEWLPRPFTAMPLRSLTRTNTLAHCCSEAEIPKARLQPGTCRS